MDSKFATALFLETWTVYGYELKPFCLRHSAELEAIESPIVCGGDIHPHDILIAAQICATHKVLTRYKPARWRMFRHDPGAEYQKLRAYLSESRSSPDLYDSPEGSGASPWKSDWQLIVVTTLIRCSTITREEAWTMPQGEALWTFHAIREQECGHSQIYSEEEQQADAELLIQNERDRPMHERRMANLALRHAGKWPAGIPWDIDAELPAEEESNG